MRVSTQELKRILRDFNAQYKAAFSAIVSRSGVPIAWELPPEMKVDHLATLSATIMGAAEVIYTGLTEVRPKRVLVESEGGTLIATGSGGEATGRRAGSGTRRTAAKCRTSRTAGPSRSRGPRRRGCPSGSAPLRRSVPTPRGRLRGGATGAIDARGGPRGGRIRRRARCDRLGRRDRIDR